LQTGVFEDSDILQIIGFLLIPCKTTSLEIKSRDFEKLVFNPAEAKKALLFEKYIRQKLDQSRV